MSYEDWCVTDFQHTSDDDEMPHYGTWTCGQLERCPTTDKLHWQLYVRTKKIRPAGARKLMPHCNVERCISQKGLEAYVHKEESRVRGPYEWGVKPTFGQGKRTDLAAAIETWKLHGKRKACEEHPSACARYFKGIELVVEACKPIYVPPSIQLRPYQASFVERFLKDDSDRHIYWVTDYVGNMGKSTTARYLQDNHGAIIYMADAKYADLAHTYNLEPIVVFDLGKSGKGEISKDMALFLEGIKNGLIQKTKYESKMLRFPPAKVLVFSNTSAPVHTWSDDRLIITFWDAHTVQAQGQAPFLQEVTTHAGTPQGFQAVSSVLASVFDEASAFD